MNTSQPKQISDIKKFIEYTQRKDAKGQSIHSDSRKLRFWLLKGSYFHGYWNTAARIKKNATRSGKVQTKFKLRCARQLYTLVLDDPEKAEKLKSSLPPGAQQLMISISIPVTN